MKLSVHLAIRIDKRGKRIVVLEPGFYVYVGSGWGPGGLRARLKRHLMDRRRRLHWHIDRLLASGYARPVCVVYSVGCNAEKRIARVLSTVFDPIPGFGSSDDKESASHLFRLAASSCSGHVMCYLLVSCLTRSCGAACIAGGDVDGESCE
ncbi:protein of unknown function DUF123 [Pyrolobus fumarii 1A]|uniref:GIY-YIG domain-containing protein n=1 Tax=Pyrolobus fumarii (strain DSM 11204 / 1A) TaxID=694429 RepID=G0EHJ1_PYRF1|nr:DUF123 domain-containing protein [Pyrolobus fumarii]AEM39344.1 protein of unknown function DUF123 [Pyrolobus fumarii 1A]